MRPFGVSGIIAACVRICVIGKVPPIQGGVSRRTFWSVQALARAGHRVWAVTNADEALPEVRLAIVQSDRFARRKAYAGGGRYEIVSTQPLASKHVLWANPFVTKLAGMATRTIRQHRCRLIYAFYFDPYGLAACLAARWTGVPFVVKHAGSDLGLLVRSPQLRLAYAEMLTAAKYVITEEALVPFFQRLGVRKRRLHVESRPFFRGPGFSSRGPALDVNRRLRDTLREHAWLHPAYREFAAKRFDPSVPTVLMYGKLLPFRGVLDAVDALVRVRREGKTPFQFVVVGGGYEHFDQLVARLRDTRLGDRTWLVPYLPPWKIPEAIRMATAVCFLEHDQPMEISTPTVPFEVLSCGACLVLSREVAQKATFLKDRLIDGTNFVAADPTNRKQLARTLAAVLGDPQRAREIGRRGERVVRGVHMPLDDYVAHNERFFRALYR